MKQKFDCQKLEDPALGYGVGATTPFRLVILLLIAQFALVGCAIKTVIVDRQTLMEAESAGDWPDADKKILQRTKKKGGTFFKKEEVRGKMARPYNVLNGELTETTK